MKSGAISGGTLLSAFADRPSSTRDTRRRDMVLVVLALVALLLHAGLFRGLDRQLSDAASPRDAAVPLQVRMLEAAPLPTVSTSPEQPVRQAPAARVLPPTKQVVEPAFTRAAISPVLPVAAEPVPSEPVVAAAKVAEPAEAAAPPAAPLAQPAESAEARAPDADVPAAPAASTPADRELPVYRTAIPPALTLRYQLRRGALQGIGELQWRPDGERYEARLEGRLAGITVLTQTSQGGFDEAGVAPLRFTDQRLRGALRAANFQREAGKISFSGPTVEYPLLMGSQDRLSWMVQLAAVVAAEPQRLQDGGKVVIHVVGARGDSKLWVFRFIGLETVATGAAAGGTVRAAHFMREAADAYDTRVDVWLDPLRHHLPARAVLRSSPDDEGLELLVQDAVAVP